MKFFTQITTDITRSAPKIPRGYKTAAAEQKMRKTPLGSFKSVMDQFRETADVDRYASIPVVVIPTDLWCRLGLVGYGYVLDARSFESNRRFIERALSNPDYMRSLPSENRTDAYLFKILQQTHASVAIAVVESPTIEYFLVHELAHLVAADNPSILPDPEIFEDEYLDRRDEQFAHLEEMDYAKKRGMNFDEWFEMSWPNTMNVLRNPGADPELYSLALMDYRDYQKLWRKTDAQN